MLICLLPRPPGVAWAGAAAVVGLAWACGTDVAGAAVGWAAGAAEVGCAAGEELGPHAALTETPATSRPSERRSRRRVGPRWLVKEWWFKFMNVHCAFVLNSAHLLMCTLEWSIRP